MPLDAPKWHFPTAWTMADHNYDSWGSICWLLQLSLSCRIWVGWDHHGHHCQWLNGSLKPRADGYQEALHRKTLEPAEYGLAKHSENPPWPVQSEASDFLPTAWLKSSTWYWLLKHGVANANWWDWAAFWASILKSSLYLSESTYVYIYIYIFIH